MILDMDHRGEKDTVQHVAEEHGWPSHEVVGAAVYSEGHRASQRPITKCCNPPPTNI